VPRNPNERAVSEATGRPPPPVPRQVRPPAPGAGAGWLCPMADMLKTDIRIRLLSRLVIWEKAGSFMEKGLERNDRLSRTES